MEEVLGADSASKQLPGPFKALPRLLRDDALAHLKREYNGTVMLQSDHPLKGTNLDGRYRLHVPGAAQLTIQIDARSELDGSARLRFCSDEAGQFEVAQFEGVALGRWQNVTASGDTVWVHATGETAKRERSDKRKLWGFCVRMTAEGWMPPEVEAQTLDTPLPIGWQLLELLCEHRPVELLTNHTYLVLTKYVHTAASPHRAAAASLLLRLLKLSPREITPPLPIPTAATHLLAASGHGEVSMPPHEQAAGLGRVGAGGGEGQGLLDSRGEIYTGAYTGADPRAEWPMAPLHGLLRYVEWHAEHGGSAGTPLVGLLPHEIQLYAELVAHAQMRRPVLLSEASQQWVGGVSDLCHATAHLLPPKPIAPGAPPPPPRDVLQQLPGRWLVRLQGMQLDVLTLQADWSPAAYGALVRFADKRLGGPKGVLATAAPRSLPAPGASGLLGGTTEEEARARFGLLQLFNEALRQMFRYAFTGYTDRPHTLGAELASLRELLFPETKQHFWQQMLDAAAPVQPPRWTKENPPVVVTVNRHRAAKERPDRRAEMRSSIMAAHTSYVYELRPTRISSLVLVCTGLPGVPRCATPSWPSSCSSLPTWTASSWCVGTEPSRSSSQGRRPTTMADPTARCSPCCARSLRTRRSSLCSCPPPTGSRAWAPTATATLCSRLAPAPSCCSGTRCSP